MFINKINPGRSVASTIDCDTETEAAVLPSASSLRLLTRVKLIINNIIDYPVDLIFSKFDYDI